MRMCRKVLFARSNPRLMRRLTETGLMESMTAVCCIENARGRVPELSEKILLEFIGRQCGPMKSQIYGIKIVFSGR
jgi:hypothetical protein